MPAATQRLATPDKANAVMLAELNTPAWDAEFEGRVAALTVADVNATFRKWIRPEALVIVEAGDFRSGLNTSTEE